ncbi:GSCOCG00013307001-RA-CDS [Cotesia congregata]|nr:GSCOCG00013307001-RA-CDS [Cotesia congregata]
MKVVHFDPNTAQGQAIADQHIRDDATHLKPVNVVASGDDNTQYNRYLPLKVSGASFPIPDVPELKDRKISSVVVLAPVDYNFRDEEQRFGKKISEPMPAKFLAGDTLKQLIRKPTAENYKKWLEQESQTEPQKQSVVLLVTTPKNQSKGDKEIFMYDVSTQAVSKLSGDLSSAFVDAAESNSESPESIDDSSFTS